MYKAVLFDLDGTVVDSSEGILNSAKEALAELGMDVPSDDEIRSCIGPPIGETLEKVVGFSQLEKKRFYELFRSVYKDKYLFQCSLYPGMTELLKELRKSNCLLGIATNKRIDTTKLLLDQFGIIDLFDVVVSQDRNEIKNKSDMISDALLNLMVDRNDAVMIGDSQNDLDAAKGAGVSFIGVCYGFGFKEPIKEEIELVDSVEDLRDLLIS
jgi:phosphoglycolate phosphatase